MSAASGVGHIPESEISILLRAGGKPICLGAASAAPMPHAARGVPYMASQLRRELGGARRLLQGLGSREAAHALRLQALGPLRSRARGPCKPLCRSFLPLHLSGVHWAAAWRWAQQLLGTAGKGNFGMVVAGRWRGSPVAIKQLPLEDERVASAFAAEAAM